MNDAHRVRGREGREQLVEKRRQLAQLHGGVHLQVLVERVTLEQVHHDVRLLGARDGAEAEDVDDGGVADGVDGARFTNEALHHLGIIGVVGLEDLDGHGLADDLVHPAVHHAHRTGADERLDLVALDHLTQERIGDRGQVHVANGLVTDLGTHGGRKLPETQLDATASHTGSASAESMKRQWWAKSVPFLEADSTSARAT